MHRILALMVAAAMLGPLSALAQDGRAALESAAKALGVARSIEYTAPV
jgi:hypothetical protein